jgi:type I restriction enzyme, S subunit
MTVFLLFLTKILNHFIQFFMNQNDSVLADLPSGWKWVKLGEICKEKEGLRRGPFGSAIKKEFFIPIGYKVYEQSNAIYDDAFRGKYFISEDKYKELKNFEVQSGDLIVSCSGTLGRISEIPNNAPKGVINQALLRVRLKEELIVKQYFLYIFRSANFQRNIFDQSQGTAMTNLIGIKDFKEVTIPLPPLSIQEKIVEKLETLLSELDRGKAQLLTAQAQLKTYRQAVLKYAFEGKLTGDTEGWEWVKLKDAANIFSGYAFKSDEFENDGTYQVIRMGNVRQGLIRKNENAIFLSKVEDKILKNTLLKIDDVIITLTGTRQKRDYGYTVLIKEKNFLLNQRLAAFRFHQSYLPKFFLYYSWTDSFKDKFFEYETGNVGQGNVGVKAITETEIPLPPLSTQQKIVSEIESRLSVCDKLEEMIKASLLQSESLRQSILKRAFEGKLV